MPRKPHDLTSELRHHFQRLGVAEVVPADHHGLGEGGYVIQVATRCRGSRLEVEPLRYPVSRAAAFWSDRDAALAFLADALEDL